jgi:peptidyl-tRNA hydrolase, PTH1 family
MMPCTRLVVGLGNPGKEYEWTRHNVGSLIVKAYAKREGWQFKPERLVNAYVAKGEKDGVQVFIAYLSVFMNESGQAVKKLLKHLMVSGAETLVVFDDIETKWLDSKVVFSGGTRGHNGIRSLQSLLATKDFFQLRVGVGHPGENKVAGYVLSRFSEEEREELPILFEQAEGKIDVWLREEKVQGPCATSKGA